VSKTRVGWKSHRREKDDLTLEKKGCGKNLRKKSGIFKGVSARYKTKKRLEMGVWAEAKEEELEVSVTFLE
jgi:hypothetical protein